MTEATGFFAPMLAKPWRGKEAIEPGVWAAEEKYDGHRLVVLVSDQPDGLFEGRTVRAWSRHGEERLLPAQVREGLLKFPPGRFDGELYIPGGAHWDVKALAREAEARWVCFDAFEVAGRAIYGFSYDARRAAIAARLDAMRVDRSKWMAPSTNLNGPEDADKLRAEVWDRGGEGLILKRRLSLYAVGKRSPDWLKVKKFKVTVCIVTGFREGRSGATSVVELVDDDGQELRVKALNDAERRSMEADPTAYVGRRLMVEHQGRTPDGGYRHPMWDRWVDPGEGE